MSHRYLGVDLGTKRIGLAIGDDQTGIASPLDVIETGREIHTTTRALIALAHEYDVTDVIIGLPLNMDDTEGSQAKLSRRLAEAIEQLASIDMGSKEAGSPLVVHLYDERLTSFAADQLMARTELTHKQKKSRHDALAATVMLQSYLDRQANA